MIKNNDKDTLVIRDFGDEWVEYNQLELGEKERNELFYKYFSIFLLN